MKKVFMSVAVVAMMIAAVACGNSNNSKKEKVQEQAKAMSAGDIVGAMKK